MNTTPMCRMSEFDKKTALFIKVKYNGQFLLAKLIIFSVALVIIIVCTNT
jgi:hypothetical protein